MMSQKQGTAPGPGPLPLGISLIFVLCHDIRNGYIPRTRASVSLFMKQGQLYLSNWIKDEMR